MRNEITPLKFQIIIDTPYEFDWKIDENTIICITVGKYGKENMEGLKSAQLSIVIVTLLYSTLLDNLPVKGSILLDFLVFIDE